jgi:hypothetical protein
MDIRSRFSDGEVSWRRLGLREPRYQTCDRGGVDTDHAWPKAAVGGLEGAMRSLTTGLSCLLLAVAVALPGSAAAAQVVTVDYGPPDSDGLIYPTGPLEWPGEGNRALATVEFTGLELVDANFFADIELRKTWWDDFTGSVTGNEYSLAFDCGTANGCLTVVSPGVATGWLEMPRGYDKPCNAAAVGDCSEHYEANFAVFDGVFRAVGNEPYSLVVTVGDPIVVPEAATWLLMITGFGGVGAVLRSRRRFAAV